jgi:GntR family transcriptional regulator / MocR family aminotransferase
MVQLPLNLELSGTTLQERIYNGIRSGVLSHRLASGSRLPSSRELAESMAVSRNTVVLAYDRLAAEGYIELKSGIGTFVSKELPEKCLQPEPAEHSDGWTGCIKDRLYPNIEFLAERPVIIEKGFKLPSIDFWYGRANPRLFPTATWRRLITHNLGRAAVNMIEYPPAAGLPELRQAIAEHAAINRGIKTDWRNVIVTTGAQEAFDIIAKLFIKPGTRVAIESPCYQGIAFTLRAHGATLIPIPVDSGGMKIDCLERQRGAALVCATPSHQFPTGETLTLERRFRMLCWAGQVGAYIVEDDYDGDFRYSASPLPAMAGLDGAGDSVVYVGTFSKSLGAGLRIGFLIVPDRVVKAAVCAKALASNGQPWLDQVVLAEFLASGAYGRHLRKLRQAQMQSRDALLTALTKQFGTIDVSGTEAGMHLMWRMPADFPEPSNLAAAARALDVGIYPPSAAGAEVFGEPERAILFGYPALTESQIAEGISRVRTAVDRML